MPLPPDLHHFPPCRRLRPHPGQRAPPLQENQRPRGQLGPRGRLQHCVRPVTRNGAIISRFFINDM
jgi:hypothetical protein